MRTNLFSTLRAMSVRRTLMAWLALLLAFTLTAAQAQQAVDVARSPATILIIRHAEKLTDGRSDLSAAGFARADRLPQLFVPGARPDLPLPQVLFATHRSPRSNRPVETITPLAAALQLPIDDSIDNDDYQKLAATLLGGKYAGNVVLVAWHHGKIPQLATALGAAPPYAPWPEQQYDRIWRIDYVAGKAVLTELPFRLMPGDAQ